MIPRGGDGYYDLFMTSLFLDSLMVIISYCCVLFGMGWSGAPFSCVFYSFYRLLLSLRSDISRIVACLYFDIAAPSLAQVNGIVKLPNQLRFLENAYCSLAICQDALPCTGAKRERLIKHARIRDLA